MIELSGVSKDYLVGQSKVHAVSDVSFEIAKGEFAAIAGPSGSGKSTLLNLIGGIERPSAGRLLVDGQSIGDLTPDQSALMRRAKMGFIFQTFNLLPVFTAYENVEYPLHLLNVPNEERRRRVDALLKEVGMSERADHKPSQLSGGQRQRVAIARALAAQPSVVLADEPTANLDHQTADEIIALMKKLHQDHGVTIIFSTHDPRIIEQANRLIRLDSGRLATA